MILEIDPIEPEPWLLARAAQVLRDGGVVVMPTDTVYGITCGITHHEAIRRIYKLKDMDPKKPLSILVGDMAMVGRYARGVTTPAFRLLKRVLPGPYTFIFEASPEVPKIMLRKRRTIGIRMPDNPIALALLAEMGEPLLSTSIRGPEQDFVNNPEELDETLGNDVEMVIDGGILLPVPSTVVDLSGGEPVLLREGKGGRHELFSPRSSISLDRPTDRIQDSRCRDPPPSPGAGASKAGRRDHLHLASWWKGGRVHLVSGRVGGRSVGVELLDRCCTTSFSSSLSVELRKESAAPAPHGSPARRPESPPRRIRAPSKQGWRCSGSG